MRQEPGHAREEQDKLGKSKGNKVKGRQSGQKQGQRKGKKAGWTNKDLGTCGERTKMNLGTWVSIYLSTPCIQEHFYEIYSMANQTFVQGQIG